MTPTPHKDSPGTDLLPCPFCGGDATMKSQKRWAAGVRVIVWQARCMECGVHRDPPEMTHDEAIGAWNRRTEGPAGAATASPANPRGVKALSENEIASVEAPDPRTPDRRSGNAGSVARPEHGARERIAYWLRREFCSATGRDAPNEPLPSNSPFYSDADTVIAMAQGAEARPSGEPEPAVSLIIEPDDDATIDGALLREYERRKLTYTETLLDRYTNHATRLRPADVDAAEHSLDVFVETLMRRTPASVVQPQEWRTSDRPIDAINWLRSRLTGLVTGLGDAEIRVPEKYIAELRKLMETSPCAYIDVRDGKIEEVYKLGVTPPDGRYAIVAAGVVEREGNVMREDDEAAARRYDRQHALAFEQAAGVLELEYASRARNGSAPRAGWNDAAAYLMECAREFRASSSERAAPQEQARDAGAAE